MTYPKFLPNPVTIYKFLTDKDTDWKPKAAFILALIYIISPFDFDWIPIIGWIDDAFVGMIAMWYVNHETNTWQDKQITTAQSAKRIAEQEAVQIVEGSGVTLGDEQGLRAQIDTAQAEAEAEVEAVSIPTSRGSA